ncbi:hypothetical protein [Chromobacterium violaceum]|nr:hypothetical protein [Chromobacterium violaceum]
MPTCVAWASQHRVPRAVAVRYMVKPYSTWKVGRAYFLKANYKM